MDLIPSSPLSHEVSLVDEAGVNLSCVGSILSSYLILTLASCLHGNGIGTRPKKLTIGKKSGNGQISNSKWEEEEQITSVSRVIFHPDYETDLAILVLDENLNLNPGIKILPILSVLNKNAGESTSTGFSGRLCRENSALSSLRISEPSQFPLSSAFLCLIPLEWNSDESDSTGKNSSSSCSRPLPGSSLLCSDENRGHFLCGILAFSPKNLGERCQIYANIANHLEWIQSVSAGVQAEKSSEINGTEREERSSELTSSSDDSDYDYKMANYFPDFGNPTRKMRSVDYEVDAQIAHGVTVNKLNPILYQLSIRYCGNPPDGEWAHICGGVILDEKTALTAAHCFAKTRDVSHYRVVAGENRLNSPDAEEQVLALKKVIIHPEYKSTTNGNDIAILHVEEFIFNGYVGGVWLSPFLNEKLTNKTAVISGWGNVLHNSGLSMSLQKGNVSILPPEDCLNRLKNRMKVPVRQGVVCALDNLTRTCSGDSGGPLVIQSYKLGGSTGNLLVGITSFGATNCSLVKKVGVFTEISSFFNWIQENRATPLGCGGFIKLDGEDEIFYKVPTELRGEKSVCVWVVAAVNGSKIEMEILNNPKAQFQPEESTLSAFYDNRENKYINSDHMITLRKEEISKIDRPLAILYFRTSSSASNSGFHIRLKEGGKGGPQRPVKYLELGLTGTGGATSTIKEIAHTEVPVSYNSWAFIIVKPGARHAKLKLDVIYMDKGGYRSTFVELIFAEFGNFLKTRLDGSFWDNTWFEADTEEPLIFVCYSYHRGFKFSYFEQRKSEPGIKKRLLPSAGKMELDHIKNPVPYQLSIRLNGSHRCNGVILDKKTALTNAGCVDVKAFKLRSYNLSDFLVVAGEQNIHQNDTTEQILEVQKVTTHPKYKNFNEGNDISVILLKGEFGFNDRVNSVWISSQTPPNFQNFTGWATGWGSNTTGDISPVLLSFELEFVGQDKCIRRFGHLPDSAFCGYNSFSNTCRGDAGGPLVIRNYEHAEDMEKDLLVGISSLGPRECERQDMPNAFINVSVFYDWIAQVRSNSLCSSSEFQCFNGECIHKELQCDKKFDCEDGSDEKTCKSHSRVTGSCGGLIKLAYSMEIQWRAPTVHPHPNSSCLWIIANPHDDRPAKTQIKILSSPNHHFDNASSQLYVMENLTASQLSTSLLNEIDFEYNFTQPFLMLYFRTNSTGENNGIHLKISDKSESSDYVARNVQGFSFPADLSQDASQSQSQSQSFSHVYSASHCKSKVKSRYISKSALLQNSSHSQNPPYIVSIRLDGEHICSGVILDKRTVLSTASCFGLDWQEREDKTVGLKSSRPRISRTRIQVVAGEQNLKAKDSAEQILEIERFLKHEKWTFSNGSQGNDIALILIQGEFTFNEHVSNIWISTPEMLNLTGLSGSVSAWISTSKNLQKADFLPDLKTMNMEIMSNSECMETYSFLDESMICGFRNLTNVCSMTGAPLVLKDQSFGLGNVSREVLIGLSSFGPEAEPEVCESTTQPVAFTRVDYFYDWIERNRANSQCSPSKFQCYNGGCIRKELKCNYIFDCSDGSDEAVCKSGSSKTIRQLDSCARRFEDNEIDNAAEDQSYLLELENLFVFMKPVQNGGRIQVHLNSLQMGTAQDSLQILSYRQNTEEITQLDRFYAAGNWSDEIYYGDENEPVLVYFHARPAPENQRVNLKYVERPRVSPSTDCGGDLELEDELEIVYQVPPESQNSRTSCTWNIRSSKGSLIQATLFHNPSVDFDAATSFLTILGNSAGSNSTEVDEKYETYETDVSSLKLSFVSENRDSKTGFHLFLKNQKA